MADAKTYAIVMRKRDDHFFIVCEWSNGERDELYQTPGSTAQDETNCEMVYTQMLEKFPTFNYSHRDIMRISAMQPKRTVAEVLNGKPDDYREVVIR